MSKGNEEGPEVNADIAELCFKEFSTGIKLKAIFKRNNWKESYIPQEGEKIYLRGRKK